MRGSTVRVGWLISCCLVAALVAGVFAWAIETQSYNVWGAVLVTPLVVAVNAALIWKVARRGDEPWLPTLLGIAFVAKLGGAVVRYLVAYGVYGGVADAERYNIYAADHYELWRQGFVVWEWAGKQGTQYMELITTAIYAVIGPSPLAAFFVFASFAFWGQYLLYRAFRVALPSGDGRRYGLLVFLLPSMLYWPASIGKESWLLLFVGVTALGAAKLFTGQRGAFALLATGAVGTAIIRPHISVLLFAALFVAQLFRPTGTKGTSIVSKAGGVVVLAVAAFVLTTQSASFLGIDDLDWQAVSETVDAASGQASQGGSAFTPVPVGSPWGIVAALVTVLFRPFPWEAGNAQMLVQSLEGLLLVVLTVRAWPRLRRLPSIMKANPYVVFCVVYSAAFIWAFAGFGNFGILARQRVLMIPVFLVLLALPSVEQARSHGRRRAESHDVLR